MALLLEKGNSVLCFYSQFIASSLLFLSRKYIKFRSGLMEQLLNLSFEELQSGTARS